MNIKEKISKLGNEFIMPFFEPISSNRDFEFNASLEDHPIGNQNIYRLYYVNYHRIEEYNGRSDNNIGMID